MLPVLAAAILSLGVGGSAVLGFLWPIVRIGTSMDLAYVVTEPVSEGTVFNIPLFILGAGPSLLASVVLFAASSIIDELRKSRSAR